MRVTFATINPDESGITIPTMSTQQLKRVSSSLLHSVLEGAGSILDLGGASSAPFRHSPMARQDRDTQALRGDWQRIGQDLNAAMDNIRRSSSLR